MPVQHNSDNNQYWFEALFNYATIGIIVTDEKGNIINFNKQAEKDFGYLREELTGKPVELLLPAAAKTKHVVYRQNFYEHPSPRAMGHGRDLFARKKNGSVFPVEVSLSNYTVNEELFVIAFVIDITIRKQHELVVLEQKEELERVTTEIKNLNTGLEKKVEDRTKTLRETLTELEKSKHELSNALIAEQELGELKTRFVAMASHEFKTPLSTILSSAFLLEKYNVLNEPEKRQKHILRIKNAVENMRMILDDFLSIEKLDEGIIQVSLECVPAATCFKDIENIINEMQVNCRNGQVIKFEKTGDNTVFIDRHLLKNICLNLLSNAIKFSPENAVIQLRCVVSETEFILSVQDEGIGIATEDKQHLFERFYRAKNAFNIQGTGLGLHIVKKYLELMNGYIEVETALNKGSVFTIHIPQ